MATNFATWSTSNQYGTYSYVLSYDLLSQSTANNTSTIRVYGTINLPVYISWSRGNITINNASFGLATYYSAGSYTIGYTDITVYHNDDGTGSVYVSGSISTSYLMNGSCGGTIYLPTIPRASVPSINTYPNNSPDFDIGDTITIHMNRKSTSFTHDVRLDFGSFTYQIATGVIDNCILDTSTIANSLYQEIPNSSVGTGNIVVTTYNGSTYIGLRTCPFYAHVVDANPTFTDFEFEDLNSDTVTLTGDDQAIIKGYSNIGIRIPVANKAEAIKGATMSKYRLIVGNYTEDLPYSDSAMVSSSTILKVTTGTINVYAIDSRNNSTLVTKLATKEINYTPAIINSSSKVERNDSGVGTNAILTYSGTYWNDDFGDEVNAIQNAIYEFKPTSSTTWITGTTNITPTISGSDFSFTGIVRSDASDYSFDIATSYDFRITITDKLTTTVYVFTPLASGTPNLALSENGTAIGMAYDENEGGAIQFIDDVKLYDSANDTWRTIPQEKNRDVATATFTNDKTSLPGGVLTFDTIKSTSNKLTLSGGGIRIGAGISKVLVSGNVFFQWTSANQNYLYMAIRKGSTNVSLSIEAQPFNYAFATLSFAPVYVEVQEGDTFYIVSLEGKTGTFRGGQNSYMTLEVIE